MRGRSKLRAKASRFAAYGAYVAETVGGSLATSTAALSALTFLLVLAFSPAGGPVSGLPVLLYLTSVGYSVVALAGASAMVSDLKGPAQVFLSQPISRTAYALAWLSALLTSALATFSAFLLSFAVIDPVLLRAVDATLAAVWLLDAAILALALLAAAVLARRASVLVTPLGGDDVREHLPAGPTQRALKAGGGCRAPALQRALRLGDRERRAARGVGAPRGGAGAPALLAR
jgi:hypothetical protein